VAQRTGAERFLAPTAKTASAGVLPALAVAALLLSGCGGGSSEEASEAPTDSTSATASATKSASGESASPNAAAAKAKAKAGEGSPAAKGAAGPGPAGSAAEGQKHGPIAAPKGPPEQALTSEQVANATVADIALQSPAITAANGSPGRLAATYTCDGKDSWPALSWGGVPAGTKELILYAMNVQPVQGQLFVDWAVAGLDPGLEEIAAGELPKGAVVGKNSFAKTGYSLCPQGNGEIYMFALYALPQSLELKRGFDAREVRKQILDASGNVGLLPAVYERG
jgi:phosphatidylethanolamine-binding protein (PEBP) family uncharacterized protein